MMSSTIRGGNDDIVNSTTNENSKNSNNSNSNNNNYVVSNPSKLLSRHYETIGIDDVFICPPPHPLLSNYLLKKSSNNNKSQQGEEEEKGKKKSSSSISLDFSSWEFVGQIKTNPEDFVVREIFVDRKNKSIPGLQQLLTTPPPRRKKKKKTEEVGRGEDSSDDDDEEEENDDDPMETLRVADILDEEKLPIQKLENNDNSNNNNKDKDNDNDGPTKHEDNENDDDDDDGDTGNNKQMAVGDEHEDNANNVTTNAVKSSSGDDAHGNPKQETTEEKISLNVPSPSPSCRKEEKVITPLEQIKSFLKKAISTHHHDNDSVENSPSTTKTSIITATTTTTSSNTATSTEEEKIVSNLQKLYNDAFERIKTIKNLATPNHDNATTPVSLTTITTTQQLPPQPPENNNAVVSIPSFGGKVQRGIFHRAFKIEFPLLTTTHTSIGRQQQERNNNNNNNNKNNDDNANNNTAAQFMIMATVDEKYYELIPYLIYPEQDLLNLYTFEKRGYTEESGSESTKKNNNNNNSKKRRRRHDRNNNDISGSENVTLRLKQGLSKDDRRSVHRIISSRCKFFGTSTITNIPLLIDDDNKDDDDKRREENDSPKEKKKAKIGNSEIKRSSPSSSKNENNHTDAESTAAAKTTTAVVVTWQKHMFKSLNKKRKRGKGHPSNNKEQQYPNLLFVLKKQRKEHLTALQKVSRCIRCRPSDIGVAGIKDMHAITYQFCTIRNMKIHRAKNANKQLCKHGIELGNIYQVGWMLNNGDLEGNQFEILIRDVHRIYVESPSSPSSSTIMTERLIPCDWQHVLQMTDRIKTNGFINFYGEQRLGTPGHVSEIGVRSSDIGRALLQNRYSDAIDLLMTGRLICRGDNEREGEDMIRIRQAWKDSKGDPTLTLKAFQGKDILSREKTVLKGLQRYGKDHPLDALRCLSHSVRIFWINAYQSLIFNKVASERIKRFGNRVVKGDLYLDDGNDISTRSDVKVVKSEEDVSSVHLSQVVLPLPGYDVQYPANELGDCYERILESDGVQFKKGEVVESTAKGSYRKVVVYPSNVGVARDDVHENNIKLNFQLPKGSYATMLLRELMLTTATR